MKNIVFVLSQSAVESDLNFQYARMALAVSAEAKLAMVLSDAAVGLARVDYRDQGKHTRYADQERFLVEMEVPFYVLKDDLVRDEVSDPGARAALKPHVQIISADALSELIGGADVLFN